MNAWFWFWMITIAVSYVIFLGVTVSVAIYGWRDLRNLYRKIGDKTPP